MWNHYKLIFNKYYTEKVYDVFYNLELHSFWEEDVEEKKIINFYVKNEQIINVLNSKLYIPYDLKKEGTWTKKDLEESLKQINSPIKIFEDLTILPNEKLKSNSKNNIIIVPSFAFGTGLHETTKNCLRAIKYIFKELNLKCNTFLDYGCGSGILSIYASKLDVDNVECYDIDSLALQSCKKNIELNRVNVKILYKLKKDKYKVIVANLTKDILLQVNMELLEHLEEYSFLILGGILLKEKEEFLNNFNLLNFKLMKEYIDGEWLSLVFKR